MIYIWIGYYSHMYLYYKGNTAGVGEDGLLDYDEIEKIAVLTKPQVIVAGASAYPRIIDWKKIYICRKIFKTNKL